MAGTIVHLGATVICSHGGTATPTTPSAFVFVDKQPVITIASQYVIAGCPLPIPPATAPPPCVSGQWLVGSTMVLASGQPVVLNTGSSTCIPNGTPMNVLVTQLFVSAT